MTRSRKYDRRFGVVRRISDLALAAQERFVTNYSPLFMARPYTVAGTWGDLSGAGRDAVQASGTAQPSVVVDSGDSVASFDGGDYLVAPTSAFGTLGAATIIIAINATVLGFAVAADGTGQMAGQVLTGVTQFRWNVGGSANYGQHAFSTGWHLMAARWDKTGLTDADRLRAWLDGVEQTLAFTGTIATTDRVCSVGLGLGAAAAGTSPFTGRQAFAAVIPSAVDPTLLDAGGAIDNDVKAMLGVY